MTVFYNSFVYARFLSDSSQNKTQQEVIANDQRGLNQGSSETCRRWLLVHYDKNVMLFLQENVKYFGNLYAFCLYFHFN
jgi:hypothetical protein